MLDPRLASAIALVVMVVGLGVELRADALEVGRAALLANLYRGGWIARPAGSTA